MMWGMITVIIPVSHTQDLVINEFLASNSTILSDPDDAEFSDWIEILNHSGAPIDMGGYYLTDNLTDTTKWQFPAGAIIPAGGYLLICATLFSDAYAQSLFEESDLDIQAYRPAVVFINGEY